MRPRQHLQQVPVRVIEIEPAPAVAPIDLAPALTARVGVPLDVLGEHAREDIVEVIVVDGGSSDGTAALAEGLADAVLSAPRGRALQMNAGAAAARAPACRRRRR